MLKEAAPTKLELAIQAVARGETYLSPTVAKYVLTDYRQRLHGKAGTGAGELNLGAMLTPRQRETLQLIAEGRTTKQIAATLQVTENTVETHRRRLMARLGVHDLAGLVRAALRLGIVLPNYEGPPVSLLFLPFPHRLSVSPVWVSGVALFPLFFLCCSPFFVTEFSRSFHSRAICVWSSSSPALCGCQQKQETTCESSPAKETKRLQV